MMPKQCCKALAAVLFVHGLLASGAAFAAGQSSANFAIPRDAINAGVGDMASANFRLSSSLGDAVAGATITSVGFRLNSGFRGQISVPSGVLNLLSVVSRKLHNGTPFNLTIADQTINGNITIEPRAIGGGHTLVFHFDGPVSNEGAATALDQALNSAATVTLARSGNDVIATLSNVADNKRLTLSLTGVNGSVNVARAVGFLVGDVTGTKSVNAADISAIKANLGKPVNTDAIAKFDINADGTITASDVSAAKARSGLVMP
jgi:hypothetical protein